MGTSCEVIRIQDNTVDRIHVSYDGYLSGVGLVLFRHYSAPEKVEELFSHDSWAPSIEAVPDDISWGKWDVANFRDWPVSEYLADRARCEGNCRKILKDLADDFELGDFVYAHGKWCYPKNIDDLRVFVETGESPRTITKELLNAVGVSEQEFDCEPPRPVDELVGTFDIDENGVASLSVAGERWDIRPSEDFASEVRLDVFKDKLVRIRTSTIGCQVWMQNDIPVSKKWATILAIKED